MKKRVIYLILAIIGIALEYVAGWFITGTADHMQWDPIGKVMFCIAAGVMLFVPQVTIIDED